MIIVDKIKLKNYNKILENVGCLAIIALLQLEIAHCLDMCRENFILLNFFNKKRLTVQM